MVLHALLIKRCATISEPSQFVSYDCFGSKANASTPRLGRTSRLELGMKMINEFYSHNSEN